MAPLSCIPSDVPIAMAIAGSDSSGGAGIQADIKVMSALGVFATTAITALTAQNTMAVEGIYAITPNFVQQQITTVWDDMPISAVKIGMLGTADMTEIVAKTLQSVHAQNIVVDTVMVAKSGDRLLQRDAVQSLIQTLIPIADVITPNIPEACDILGISHIDTISHMYKSAEKLLYMGCKAVLLKGGHMPGDVLTDVYMDTHTTFSMKNPRIYTHNTHGTGCSLSSAIAAYLAKGVPIHKAVKNAITYITEAVKHADKLGKNNKGIGNGNGPIYHFYNSWT